MKWTCKFVICNQLKIGEVTISIHKVWIVGFIIKCFHKGEFSTQHDLKDKGFEYTKD